MTSDKLSSVFRPDGVHQGGVTVDAEKCIHCGLCMENCILGALEMDDRQVPQLKDNGLCFSCHNCIVACPVDAVSMTTPYHVDAGFYASDPSSSYMMPLEPYDANGESGEWNEVERLVLNRRSVRNYTGQPVSDHLVRRVLEAGRFAPSAGNCQPWRFVVISDQALIREMDQSIYGVLASFYQSYSDDQLVKNLASMYESQPTPGRYDPRVMQGGVGRIAKGKGEVPIYLGAPLVVLLLGDKRAIGSPQLHIGICGQNMNLVAKSLGLGFCWIGFSAVLMHVPHMLEKLGIDEPWEIINSFVLGHPSFKQEGMVPREYRPVTWFREAGAGYASRSE
jgi:nitroreductase/NAD-dependent dihydropyrimidine dehydrogenase PreA subunit